MNRLTKLLKEGKIGLLCKRGAGVIAILGILQAAVQLYSAWGLYQATRLQPDAFGPGNYTLYGILLPNLASVLQSVAGTAFYCVILYVAGTLINASFSSEQSDSENDIRFETIPEDEIAHVNK